MIITTSNLGKRFNREWIFKGLTMEFSKGNMYAIVGPNGSGKSTLMRVLWGMGPPSEGHLQYALQGKNIGLEDIYQHVSIVTPYMELIEEMSLMEHIEFHFKFKRPLDGLSPDEILKRLGLENARNKSINQFSSGMKQRLKLGLGFFSASEVLFLDEPTTNLDEKATEWYFKNLIEIGAKRIVFIATNQATDFPKGTSEINLSTLKPVTKRNSQSI